MLFVAAAFLRVQLSLGHYHKPWIVLVKCCGIYLGDNALCKIHMLLFLLFLCFTLWKIKFKYESERKYEKYSYEAEELVGEGH